MPHNENAMIICRCVVLLSEQLKCFIFCVSADCVSSSRSLTTLLLRDYRGMPSSQTFDLPVSIRGMHSVHLIQYINVYTNKINDELMFIECRL